MLSGDALLARLLGRVSEREREREPPHEPPDLGDFVSSIDRAILAGFSADRIGYAFAGGYRAALSRLVPSIAHHACLAATEEGGGHPRAIRTTLRPHPTVAEAFVLDGKKLWVTLGTEADELLVVASTGEADGRNTLRVVRVPAHREGVTLIPREPAPFAPEIPHSEAVFTHVQIAPNEVLPGDGYDAYLKPFRTLEDLHVLAGLVGYLVSMGRRHEWPNAALEELVMLALALRATLPLDPSKSETHVVLGGLFTRVHAFLANAEADGSMAKLSIEERDRFTRDRPLLMVAGRARGMRLEAAWRRLREG